MGKKKGDGTGKYKRNDEEVKIILKNNNASKLQAIIALRLNSEMNKRDIAIEQLASDSKVAKSAISACLNGDYKSETGLINSYGLYKIAKALNVSIDYLLGRTDIVAPDEELRYIHNKTGLNEKVIQTLIKLSSYTKTNSISDDLETTKLKTINALIERGEEIISYLTLSWYRELSNEPVPFNRDSDKNTIIYFNSVFAGMENKEGYIFNEDQIKSIFVNLAKEELTRLSDKIIKEEREKANG